MAKGKPKAPDDLSYEDAFDELQTLVEQLESGELQLEEALSVFERGQALAARCSDLLEKAQLRLTELAPSDDGTMSPVNLELD